MVAAFIGFFVGLFYELNLLSLITGAYQLKSFTVFTIEIEGAFFRDEGDS